MAITVIIIIVVGVAIAVVIAAAVLMAPGKGFEKTPRNSPHVEKGNSPRGSQHKTEHV